MVMCSCWIVWLWWREGKGNSVMFCSSTNIGSSICSMFSIALRLTLVTYCCLCALLWWRTRTRLISRNLLVITGLNHQRESGNESNSNFFLHFYVFFNDFRSSYEMIFSSVVTQNLSTLSKQCAKVVRQNRKNLGFLGCLNCEHLLKLVASKLALCSRVLWNLFICLFIIFFCCWQAWFPVL